MDHADHTQTDGSFGQFSFAPATQTTVVTTTTTTTTTFPPLIIRPPRATKDLDTKLYPLAASPTPEYLRNIRFDLGGKSVQFNEPEDTLSAVNEVSRMLSTRWILFFVCAPRIFTSIRSFNIVAQRLTQSADEGKE